MQSCPQCGRQLKDYDLVAGRCRGCGTVFTPKTVAEEPAPAESVDSMALTTPGGLLSDASSMTSDYENQSDASSITSNYEDVSDASSVTSNYEDPSDASSMTSNYEDQPKPAKMTKESELPEPMRTIMDESEDSLAMADRTIGMDGEDLPEQANDRTFIEDVPVSADANKTEMGDFSESSPRPSILPGSTTSKLNIHPRLVIRPGQGSFNTAARFDYEVIRKLGEGGMGEVWLAHQTSLSREVAVKQIKTNLLSEISKSASKSKLCHQSFLTEAVITGDLNHPNIIPVYDMGTDADGNLLYSMKCIRGTSWDKLIRTLSEEENLEILRKCSDAVAFAHSRGVVHRDLKPSNIMVGSYGEVLVMDWGTALPLAHFAKPAGMLTSSGRAGTPAYWPPEQAEGDIKKIGPHSDVYLLGAILFEIVVGIPPHPTRKESGQSLTTLELLQNALANRIVPTDKAGELIDIALKAMRSLPSDRYADVEQFTEALKHYQKHAESVLMARQAKKELATAKETQDYTMYARSVFGFENALKLWDENAEASKGLVHARLDYADAALKKENFELGLTLVDDKEPEFQETHKKLVAGQEERRRRLTRIRTLRWTAAALLFALFFGGTAAGIVINNERAKAVEAAIAEAAAKDEAVIARDEAVVARDEATKSAKAEKEAKEVAVAAQIKEQEERKKAEAAAEAERIAKIAAEQQKRAAMREWYYSQINLADQQVAQNAFDSAREILKQIDARLSEEKQTADENHRGDLAKEIGWELQRLKYVCGLSHDELIPSGPESVILTAVAATDRLLATANIRGEVQLWSAETRQPLEGKPIRTKSRPNALALSPAGDVVAVGVSNGAIQLWDLKTGKLRKELTGHQDEVTKLLYLAAGQLASASMDRTVRVWNLDENTSAVFTGHPGTVLSLARVANQNHETIGLVSGGSDREIRFWQLPPREQNFSTTLGSTDSSAVTALAAQLQGEKEDKLFVYYGDEEGNLKAFRHNLDGIRQSLKTIRESRQANATKPEAVYALIRQPTDRHQGAVTQLLIDPNDKSRLISSSRDNTLRTWTISPSSLSEAGQPLLQQTLRGHGNAIVDAAAWNDADGQGTRLLTASADGSARLWQPDKYAEVVSVGGEALENEEGAYGEVLSMSVGGDKTDRIMAVARDGVATIWNLSEKNRQIRLSEGHRFLTQSAVFLKDWLVTVSFDGTAVVWDTKTRAMFERWKEVGTTGVLAGSADGRFVITGYDSGKAKANADGAPIENLQIWSLSEARNDRALSDIRKIVAVGRNVRKNDVPDQPSTAAISPDGAWGLVGTENGYLQLIDLASSAVQETMPAHPRSPNPDAPEPEGVTGVVFLSNTEAATVGLDGWLRFWEIQNGELAEHPTRKGVVHTEKGAIHRVIGMTASADGKRLATLVRPRKSGLGPQAKPDPTVPQIWIGDLQADGVKFDVKLQPLGENQERVSSLSLTADGQRVLATVVTAQKSDGGRKQAVLQEWKLNDGKASAPAVVLTAPRGFEFLQATYLPGDADRIAVLSDALTNVWERDARSGAFQKRAAAYGPILAMQACDLSHDGKLAVTASHDLAPATDQPANAGGEKSRLRGEVRIWEVTNDIGRRMGDLTLDGAISTVGMCPTDPGLILVGGNQRAEGEAPGYAAGLYRWDGKTLTKTQSLGNFSENIIRGRFSADGKRIVIASSDGSVQVFERNGEKFDVKNKLQLSAEGRKLRLGELIAADLSDDGKWVIAADKTSALVLDVESGEPVVSELLQGHSSDLTEVRFAIRPNADAPQRLWSTSLDGTVKFWGISEGRQSAENVNEKPSYLARPLLTLRGHQRGVLALAVLPQGGVVTAGMDGRVIFWPIGPIAKAD